MKPETYLKRAMEVKDPNIRLAKLETICLKVIPHGSVWEKAFAEAQKLRAQGARYW
jgi:hypothetical protein